MKISKVMQVGVAFAALFLLFVGIFAMKAASGEAAIPTSGSEQPALPGRPLTWTATHSDTSPPLRSIPIKLSQSRSEADNENPSLTLRGKLGATDPAVQSLIGPLAMPTPIESFEGIPNLFGPIPSDTNGDVGRNEYVQIVNSGFEVWSKT